MEKIEVCKQCENYIKDKCSLISCKKCWESIIKSKLGKCPLNKWKVDYGKRQKNIYKAEARFFIH